MKTAELKSILKSKIDAINDKAFLNALNVLVESKSKNFIVLTDEQRQFINRSQKEYLEGNYFENNLVNEEIEKWLSEE